LSKTRISTFFGHFNQPNFFYELPTPHFGKKMNTMKSFAILCFLSGFLPFRAQGQDQTLTVVIRNIRNDKGTVAAALYQSDEEFMKKTWQTRSAPSRKGEVQLVFENIPAGEYAISVMHDVNKNGELDKNALGIPKEGFGFSNDAAGTFGPPGFDKGKFTIPREKVLIITMKYY
jgi:uncharacterized protein (DUF2141 family)